MAESLHIAKDDPSLSDLLKLVKKDILISLVAHHIAIIESFDAEKQTVRAKIAYKKSFRQRDSDGNFGIVEMEYPAIVDCPAMVLGGGKGSIRFPIKPGDEAIIFFNDRDFDQWFHGTFDKAPKTNRLHAFADGIALVGVRSLGNVLKDYSTDNVELFNGTAGMKIEPDGKVRILNASGDLNSILQELITEVKDLAQACASLTVMGVTSGGGTSGVPSNAAAITAIGTRITATATKLGGLLV